MALSKVAALLLALKLADCKWFGHRYPMTPHPDSQAAVGVHNKTVYLIGGHQNPSQVTTFDTVHRTFSTLPDLPGNPIIYGHGNYYTQIDTRLFMIMPEEDTISMYNLETMEFTNHWEDRLIPIEVKKNGCLAASKTHLYILGGGDRNHPTSHVQMLSLGDYLWIPDVPHMNTARNRFSCIVDNNGIMYAIGGYGIASRIPQLKWQTSIEMIDTNHILKQRWKHMGALRAPAGMTRVVYKPAEKQILILGGMYTVGRRPMLYIDHSLVHVIFTNNHTCKLLPDRLPYGVMDVSAVLVDDTIYGFGGYDGNFITSWFTDHDVFQKKTKTDDLEWLWISFLVLTVIIGMYTLWRIYIQQKNEREEEETRRKTKMVEMIGNIDEDSSDEEMGFLTTNGAKQWDF